VKISEDGNAQTRELSAPVRYMKTMSTRCEGRGLPGKRPHAKR
jgi:hypothetical protein